MRWLDQKGRLRLSSRARSLDFQWWLPRLEGRDFDAVLTSLIQNVADIWTAFAFRPELAPVDAPWRKAMLAVPPPSSGAVGVVETVKKDVLVIVFPSLALRSTVFGSVCMSRVIVPASMNLVRSCGSLGVLVADAFWLANGILLVVPIMKGVMSTAAIFGGPAKLVVGARHWALIVVPCGIDAIRVSDSPKIGSLVVAGTCIQRPGSKWIPECVPSPCPVTGLVTSLMLYT